MAYLWTDLREATTYVDAGERGCAPAGKRLWCRFGPLRSGESVTVTVAYTVPFATGDGGIVFKARPGWHRDTVENEQVVRILAPGNENAAATFVTDTSYKVGNTQEESAGGTRRRPGSSARASSSPCPSRTGPGWRSTVRRRCARRRSLASGHR